MRHSFSWLTKKAQKAKISHGYGILAIQKIKKGERVIVFGGYVMNIKQFKALPERMKSLPFQVADDLYFGLSRISEIEEADYLNHSCEPTCGFSGEITIIALRDIKKGEEITIDYAMCLTSKEIPAMKCFCGSKWCRGKIRTYDWKRKDLQKRYKGFFVPFLEKKIKNNK